MTLSTELRQAINLLINAQYTYPAPYEEVQDAARLVAAWLDAQPAAPTERWEPVEDMRWLGGLHSFNDIRVIDGMILGVWLSAPGVPPVTANIELPADLRLCRRVEVTP